MAQNRPRIMMMKLLLVIGMFSACAAQTPGQGTPPSPASAPQSPEEALRARATQFWEARVKGDLVTQYTLLEPAARERVTLTGFVLARSRLVFRSYEMQQVEVAGNEGRVTAKTTFRLNMPPSIPQVSQSGPWDQVIIMRWVRVDGLWYVKYDQQNVTEPLKAGEGES